MALTVTYSEASSNLPAYLDNWIDNFEYRGAGNFNAVKNTTDQWYAGTRIVGGVDNDKSSIIVSGDDFSYTPGVIDGTVTNLTLGSNLAYVSSTDLWVQDPGLSIGFSGATLTPAFDAAITDLSQNGSLNGLYGYFAEQGTIQTGTAGDDVMLSFGGNDSFTGGLGNDTLVFADGWANDVVLDFHAAAGDFDVLDLQGVTNISNYVDLFFNHSNWWDNSNVLTITDGANSIQLDGYVGTDMLGLILDGHFTV
ncbi:hypothetical protein [Tardiphaga sp. 709]|uniref:hypothetical protein n=1 Tax=Tardiphaga sp. 709 TaxID=3076039 RepID=UPI0028E6A1FD|nr:hypothetical protein [Tardiphaga sp. 709]WNV10419.1 hypothetical protein RSO67_04310 [Tardiphaga sp. 709]